MQIRRVPGDWETGNSGRLPGIFGFCVNTNETGKPFLGQELALLLRGESAAC